MSTIIIVETDISIYETFVERIKKINNNYTFILCNSMDEAEKLDLDQNEHAVYLINKKLQRYADFPTPYSIIYDMNGTTNIDEYVLYVHEHLSSLNEVLLSISKYSNLFDRLVLKDTKDNILIPWNDIVFIERVKRYSLIKTTDERIYSTRQPFEDLLPQLGPHFVQTHRRYIVNLAYVKNYAKSNFTLKNKVVIPVSRGCLKSVLEIWNRYREIHKIN